MKKKLLSGLLLVTLLMTVISANPTQSQKQQPTDSVRAAKSVDTAIVPSKDRILVLEERARSVEKSLDNDIKRGDRMLYQVGTLQSRQGQIIAALEKRQIQVLVPISDVQIKATPETPEVKPIEHVKPNWWKRIFRHEEH